MEDQIIEETIRDFVSFIDSKTMDINRSQEVSIRVSKLLKLRDALECLREAA